MTARALAPMNIFALFIYALLCSAHADKTPEVGQRTVWDEIMETQAARGVYIGSLLLERRRYSEAVREFAKAVIANPKDPAAHRMLGVAYYWSGQVDQAEQEFKESLRLDPSAAQSYLLLGIVYAWKGDVQASYEAFQKSAQLDPNRADIQMNLGSVEETLGKIPEAMAHFRRAVALDPGHPLYHFQLGMLYRRLGRDEEAVESLQSAIKKFPGYQDAILELGAAYERMGRLEEALDMFKRAVKIKQRDAVARFRLARLYAAQGQDPKAREVLKEVFHLTPHESGGLALSVAYGGRRESPIDKKGNTKSQSRNQEPGSEDKDPLSMIARNLSRMPLDQEAVLSVDMAFLPRPKLVRANAGETPSRLKQALERAGSLPGASVLGARREYTFKAADPQEREREIRQAISDLREVMAKAPMDAEVRMNMNLSFSERSSSAASTGKKDADKAPKVSYQPRDIGNDLGLWVMGTGWVGLVQEVLPQQEDLQRSTTSIGNLVQGVGFMALGNGQQALDAFQQVLDLDPKEDLAYLGQGVALVVLGDEAGAVKAYRQALALNPRNKIAGEGLKWLLSSPTRNLAP
jgi:tetratricopeptide (TPR) repeat protein